MSCDPEYLVNMSISYSMRKIEIQNEDLNIVNSLWTNFIAKLFVILRYYTVVCKVNKQTTNTTKCLPHSD